MAKRLGKLGRVWLQLTVPERVAFCKRVGLAGRVGSKSFKDLTGDERGALRRVLLPKREPPKRKRKPPTKRRGRRCTYCGRVTTPGPNMEAVICIDCIDEGVIYD